VAGGGQAALLHVARLQRGCMSPARNLNGAYPVSGHLGCLVGCAAGVGKVGSWRGSDRKIKRTSFDRRFACPHIVFFCAELSNGRSAAALFSFLLCYQGAERRRSIVTTLECANSIRM
jgi:hypothetical protein